MEGLKDGWKVGCRKEGRRTVGGMELTGTIKGDASFRMEGVEVGKGWLGKSSPELVAEESLN